MEHIITHFPQVIKEAVSKTFESYAFLETKGPDPTLERNGGEGIGVKIELHEPIKGVLHIQIPNNLLTRVGEVLLHIEPQAQTRENRTDIAMEVSNIF